MKKSNKLSQTIILIFIFPIVILMVLFLLVYTPIDIIRYRFSNHRKDMKRLYGKDAKYTWLATLTYHFKVYELISKSNLPIQYFRNSNEYPCTYGYFYYNKILFLVDIVPHFDYESGNWSIVEGHDESDLYGYMESEKENFHKCMGYHETVKCERVVFIVKEKEIYDEEKSRAENADFILMYNKKNFADQINKFLSN